VTSDRSHRRDHYRGCFVATPTTADARWRGGWWGPALGGFALGALIGSAFPRPYYAYPYYGYGYGYPAYGYGYAAYSYGYPAYNYAYPAYYGDSPRPYYGSRERFLTELTLDPPNGTSGRAGAPLLDEDYTVLSTIHSAKGQEWRIVRILNVVDGCIPSDMATRTPEEIEEERRLLYVANDAGEGRARPGRAAPGLHPSAGEVWRWARVCIDQPVHTVIDSKLV
jgi:hypothetical protein